MKKTSKIKIAGVYAKAIYDGTKNPEKTFQEITGLLDILPKDPTLIEFLSNPIIDHSVKKSAIVDIAKKLRLSDELKNAFTIITENNRAADLLPIFKEFQSMYYINNSTVEVSVDSVQELSKSQQDKLQKRLEDKLNKKVVIKYNVKPELLGGLVVEYQSLMIDESIKGKLDQFTKIMKGEQLCL